MTPSATLLQGDARAVLATLPEHSVHMMATSPPYWALRSYLPGGHKDKEAELGSEPVPDCLGWATGAPCGACWVCHLLDVFRAVKRVLRPDGTCWVNLGDAMAGSSMTGGNDGFNASGGAGGFKIGRQFKKTSQLFLPSKNLIGLPWRFALAMQADGWILRASIVWAKGLSFCPAYSGSVMPESATDRPTRAYEYVFLFSQRARYFYDADAVREVGGSGWNGSSFTSAQDEATKANLGHGVRVESSGRNLRNCWAINPAPLRTITDPDTGEPLDHYAAYPPELVRPMIRAGTSAHGCCPECGAPWERLVAKTGGTIGTEHAGWQTSSKTEGGSWNTPAEVRALQRGYRREVLGWYRPCACPDADPAPCTVLDPFAGSGTTGIVALEEGRHFIGIELNPKSVRLAQLRLAAAHPLLVPTDQGGERTLWGEPTCVP